MSVFHALDHETPNEDIDELEKLAFEFAGGECDAIEVGSWVGRTALALAPFFRRVYCVDTFQGTPSDRLGHLARGYPEHTVLRTFCENAGHQLFDKIVPCVGESRFWASVWPHSRRAGLIFLDADHEYTKIRGDILAWRGHVREGGFLCGHDYHKDFPGVIKAVNELIPAKELHIVGRTLWWTQM